MDPRGLKVKNPWFRQSYESDNLTSMIIPRVWQFYESDTGKSKV